MRHPKRPLMSSDTSGSFFWPLVCGVLAWVLTPLFLLLWVWRFGRFKEKGSAFVQRLGVVNLAPLQTQGGQRLWLHGASVGESMAFEGLLYALLKADASLSVVLTTNTRTSANIWQAKIQKNPLLQKRVVHRMMPFDHPLALRLFLRAVKPKAVVLNESDFWPNMLFLLQKKRVSVVVFGAQLSARTKKKWRLLPSLLRAMLQEVQLFTPSNEMASSFQDLGLQKVTLFPSLKWAHPSCSQAESGQKTSLASLGLAPAALKTRLVWVALSTHLGEEDIILKAFCALRQQDPSMLLMIAPRYTKSLAPLELLMRMLQLDYTLLSKMSGQRSVLKDVLVIDQMGVMRALLPLSRFVFVGGSLLEGMQGHNLIEPALAGCVVLHGPYMGKNEEAATFFQQQNAALCVTKEDLKTVMQQLVRDPEVAEKLAKVAQKSATKKGQEVLKAAAQKVQNVLKAGES
ncbi:MAG: glycosyltransferase N-terminal domain-containing protein [Holosporaceae bacterium]